MNIPVICLTIILAFVLYKLYWCELNLRNLYESLNDLVRVVNNHKAVMEEDRRIIDSVYDELSEKIDAIVEKVK